MKLLVKLVWSGRVGLVTEALPLAQRHGLAPARVAEQFRGQRGAFAEQHLPARLRGDYLRDFGLDRCVEELAAVADAAGSAGLPHPVTAAVADLHRAALGHYGPVDGELLGAARPEHLAGRRHADDRPTDL